jgi:hypothetical protein
MEAGVRMGGQKNRKNKKPPTYFNASSLLNLSASSSSIYLQIFLIWLKCHFDYA